MTDRYLTLSAIPVGVDGAAGSDDPEVLRERGYSFAQRLRLAEIARDGGFDALWLPDLPHHFRRPNGTVMHPFEPNSLLSALAAKVPEIGIVTTVSTTYTDPYQGFIDSAGDKRTPLQWVAQLLAIPEDQLHADRPLSEEQLSKPAPGFSRPHGFFRALTDLARDEDLTVGQLGHRLQAGIGHRVLAGSPETVADDLAHWRDIGAADGFVLHPHAGGDDLPLLGEQLMPVLRQRGLIRPGYDKHSLRQRFGLD